MAQPTEVEVAGRRFTIGTMPPAIQFDVMRFIPPILEALSSLQNRAIQEGRVDEQGNLLLSDAETGVEIMKAFGLLPKEQLEFIREECLGRIRVQNGPQGTWASIWHNGQAMFDWVDYSMMMRLMLHAVTAQIIPFSAGQQAPSTETGQSPI
jgi:hypothetical protein